MATTTINPKYELRQMVYAVQNNGRIYYGEICRIRAERAYILGDTGWKYYYDMQVSESDGYFNIPEWKVYETQEEAEQALKLMKL
jgi:hypothetical protein